MRDFRFAIRSLARTPGFTLTALAALTLGIGAATTVYSVADRVLFRPLPYHDVDRLVTIGADVRSAGMSDWPVNLDEYDAWRQASRTVSDIAGHIPFGQFTLVLPDEPVEIAVSRVTENFLTLLGAAPRTGRAFNRIDFEPGAAPVALLTDGVWRDLFNGDAAVVGTSITINDLPTLIAGVLPRAFVFPAEAARYKPDVLMPLVRSAVSGSRATLIGRLTPGATVEDARAEINAIAATRGGPSGYREAPIDGATVETLTSQLAQRHRRVVQLLAGAVAALLLIGCANVANLLLARGSDRAGELALRRALGASRGSLVRLLLAESVAIAIAGGALGALVAHWAVNAVRPLVPPDLEVLGAIAVDSRALLFTSLASAFCVVAAALGPAFAATRANLMPALSRSTTRTTAGRVRLRQALIGLEVALAVILLVGAALMVGSMVRVLRLDVGFQAHDALTMRLQLPRGVKYPPRSREFVDRTLAAAKSIPGVTGAGATQNPPFANTLYAGHYGVEGFSNEWLAQGASEGGVCCTQTQYVSMDYFEAAGVPLVRGRKFAVADATSAERVAIIGERLARKFPANIDPMGHHLTVEGDPSDRRRIVGVVRDVRDMRIERPGLQAIYLPIEERGTSALTLVVRSVRSPLELAPALRQAVQQQAGPVIVTDVMTFGDLMARSTGERRLNAWLFGAFGVFALVLTAVGIGSVIAYSVAKRTREIGVRLALGASPTSVRRLLVRDAAWPVAAGLAIGAGSAMFLSRFAESMLYGITPRDLTTYLVVLAVLTTTALVAAYVPARRAARVDPNLALRAE
jgi:putative ABC transport system permease protein